MVKLKTHVHSKQNSFFLQHNNSCKKSKIWDTKKE